MREKKAKFSHDEAVGLLFGAANASRQTSQIVSDRRTRLWYLAIAFYLGQQTRTDMGAVSLMTDWLEPNQDELMYVANHIAPLVSRQINRFISSDGHFLAVPATPDFRDQRGAKAASHLLHYWHEYTHVRDRRRELAMWMVLCGTGGLYVDWDVNAGQHRRIYRDPFDESLILDAANLSTLEKNMLRSLGSVEEQAEGDMTTFAVSPFEITAPNSYTDIQDAPWIRIDKIRSLEWVWDHYPDKAGEVRPESIDGPNHQSFFRRLLGLSSGAIMSNDMSKLDNAVTVTEWWRPPSTLMRDGALIVGTGGVVLHNGPHPSIARNLDIRYPLDIARFQVIPGTWCGQGMVQHLIDPQTEYNRSRTQVIQQRDMLSHPQWSGSAVPERRRNNYGDFWIVPHGEGIQLHQPPALSQAHLETKTAALYDFQILASQNEASQGMNPAGVRSGNALSALQERDMETVGPAFEEMEGCLQRHSEKLLKLSARLMTMPRAVAVYGKAMMADVIYLRGMDLRGNTKVMLVRGSTRPKSDAAIRENLMVLIQTGALNPQDPDVQRYVIKTFEFHDLQVGLLNRDMAERRAEQENEIFASPGRDIQSGGQRPWPDIRRHDDHQLHIGVHRRFMETDEFENLPIDQQMALEAHMFKHQQELAQLAMLPSMMPQQAPQGSAPKERGTPSPPKAKQAAPA